MRDRELFIDLPESDPEVPLGAGIRSIKAAKGKIVVASYPPRETSYGLYLPDTVAGRYRPDAGIVISSGVDWLTPGEAILLPFWKGLRFSPYRSIKPTPVQAELEERIRLHPDLLLVLVDSLPEREILKSKEHVTQSGAVVAGQEYEPGTRVLFERKNKRMKMQGFGEAYLGDVIDGYLVVHKDQVFATEIGGEFAWDSVQILDADEIYMKQEYGEWKSGPKWMLVERDMAEEVDGLCLSEIASREYRKIGWAREYKNGIMEGQKLILDSTPNLARHFKFGKMSHTLQLVPIDAVWG